MLRHYIKFLYPGSFVSEEGIKEIKSREDKVEVPERAFGYQFFDREEVEKDDETLLGKEKNKSNWFYVGQKMTLDEVKKYKPDQRILITNMESNDIPAIVYTKFHQAIPLSEGDVVL